MVPINKEIAVKRNAKDSVFTHLFQDKRYVLQLYQALHSEAVDITEDRIEIITLENILVDNIYNDLGFMADKQLIVLVESQSLWTANIIIRALMYLAQTYHDYIVKENLNLYGTKRIVLPSPELYVIYTGKEVIGKDAISLSEEFFGGMQTDLEVRVRVLTNGQEGDIIYQYVAFTKVLDKQIRLHGRTRMAITETIRICKSRNLLKEYLTEHEQEVQSIMITLFDNETILKAYTKEKEDAARVEGEKRGEARGEAKGARKNAFETARRMLRKAMPADLTAEISGLTLSEVNTLKTQMTD